MKRLHCINAADKSKPDLSDEQRAELHASGLTDEMIASAGIYSAKNGQIRELLNWQPKDFPWGTGMVFPFGDDYARVKLDFPRHDRENKPIKYESPRGAPNRVYFPPGFDELFTNSNTVGITEGEKKALAVQQHGIPCIGLVGVWGWQQKRGRSDTGKTYGRRRLIPDLEQLDWSGKNIILVFDSDATTNSQVQLAESRLAETLMGKGAAVKVASIPANGGAKVGIDDYLISINGDKRAALQQLMTNAKPAELPDPLSPMDWARLFVDEHFTGERGVELRWWRNEIYRWTRTHYVKVEASELEAIVLSWMDPRKKKTKPRHAAEVVKAIAALCRVDFQIEPPCFVE